MAWRWPIISGGLTNQILLPMASPGSGNAYRAEIETGRAVVIHDFYAFKSNQHRGLSRFTAAIEGLKCYMTMIAPNSARRF